MDELNQVLANNVDFACEHIWEQYKGIQVTKPQGTYMLFLDCTKWCEAHGKTIEELQKAGSDVGVAWQDGRRFHGPCHIRMNLALPLSRVQEPSPAWTSMYSTPDRYKRRRRSHMEPAPLSLSKRPFRQAVEI